jgi:hypothetical protein
LNSRVPPEHLPQRFDLDNWLVAFESVVEVEKVFRLGFLLRGALRQAFHEHAEVLKLELNLVGRGQVVLQKVCEILPVHVVPWHAEQLLGLLHIGVRNALRHKLPVQFGVLVVLEKGLIELAVVPVALDVPLKIESERIALTLVDP